MNKSYNDNYNDNVLFYRTGNVQFRGYYIRLSCTQIEKSGVNVLH